MSKRGQWTPQGQWATDRGIAECIEQEGFGIIGAWVSHTGEGFVETKEICEAVNARADLLEALQDCLTDSGAACLVHTGEKGHSFCLRRLQEINRIAREALAKTEGRHANA